jgi:hypothetical protein
MPYVVEPLERRTLINGTILFVRGATRSGGFLDGGSPALRDDQLADINNASTATGNHGWATLARTLRDAGFVVEQITEPKGPDTSNVIAGRPIRFENMGPVEVLRDRLRVEQRAIPARIRRCGRQLHPQRRRRALHLRCQLRLALARRAGSDQSFLARYGVIVNQDNGVYALTRAGGDFAVPTHPILNGVDVFDGEGVSPLVVPETPPPACRFCASSPRATRRGTTTALTRRRITRAPCVR